MAKSAPLPDPLRPRASRVEKRRATKKSSSALPDWYHRILDIRDEEDRSPEPQDFDEDLSDAEDDDESDESSGCECGSDDDCDCDTKDADKESERSYDGSEASYYYRVKKEREERKAVLRDLRIRDEWDKELEMNIETSKMLEARVAWETFKQLEKAPMKSLVGQGFRLYSVDHVDRYHCWNHPMKRLEFYADHDGVLSEAKVDENGKEVFYGELYIDEKARCPFGPLLLPTGTGRELNVVCEELDEDDDDEYDLRFEFAGYGNEYVKVSVSSNLVARNEDGNSVGLPETFEFFGILGDQEKEESEGESEEDDLSSSLGDESDDGTP
jgi:hypothetical protein